MPSLKEVASYVRSKNAGPFWVTIDVFCDTDSAFNRIVNGDTLGTSRLAQLYDVPEEHVEVFPNPDLRVIKVSFPRKTIAGSFWDRDAHAGQYYVPMLGLEVGPA